jgi:hypothetical protein
MKVIIVLILVFWCSSINCEQKRQSTSWESNYFVLLTKLNFNLINI